MHRLTPSRRCGRTIVAALVTTRHDPEEFVRRVTEERPFTAEELERIPEEHRPAPETLVLRSRVVELDMPVFTKVLNREAVIFDGAAPEVD